MKHLLVLAAVVAAAAASSYVYHGKYPGKCGYDGLYYRDYTSFVYCSNGNSYVQPCAPGTKNSEYGNYKYGNSYSYSDFCDVNLVALGKYHGYAAPAPKYEEPKYEEPKYEEPKYEEPKYEPKKDDYAAPAYGYDRYDGYGYGYDRRDYGYGRRDYGYGRRDYGYGRRDYGYGYDRRGYY